MKMQGKPGITKANLAVIPLSLLFAMLTGADVLQSQILILQEDDFYNKDPDKAAKIAANSSSYALFATIPICLISGFLYDILGRKTVIVGIFLLGACTTLGTPLVAPSVIAYDIMRVGFVASIAVLLSNPFINDYVQVQSRGAATGLQQIGVTIGNLLSVGVLFTLTQAIGAQYVAWGLMAAIQVIWAGMLWFMVAEPDIYTAKEEKRHNKKSFCRKLFSMLKQAWLACKRDSALAISLIALTVSRNTSQLQQVTFQNWIDTFDLDNGKTIWQQQNLISNLCAIPFVFAVGKVSDKISAKILVPGVLFFQIVLMGAYMFCHDPTSWYAYFLAVFQGGSGYAIVVAMQGYAVKRVPKMIRGIIMALIAIFSAAGTILYLQVQKVFFDDHPNMVFGTLAFFDLIAFILIVVSIAFGWYGDPAPGQGDDDGASNAPEDRTALDDVGFTDEFPEVPFARDLYDEAVPEVSEYREETIAHHLSHADNSLLEGTVRGKSMRYRDTLR